MDSEVSSIRSKGEYSSASAMIETYKYEKLHVKSGSTILPADGKALIEQTRASKQVFIRLFNEGNDELRARVEVDGAEIGIPVRKVSGNYFEFSQVKPNSSDEDVKRLSSGQSEQGFFVALFAVAYGRDADFVNKYSDVLYLGALKWISP